MDYYQISYDLRTPGRDYTSLYAAIKQLTPEWKHPLESTWIVYTNRTAKEIFSVLQPEIDPNDRILIIKLDVDDKEGWMDITFWQWLNSDKNHD